MEIIVTRHGVTEFNIKELTNGRHDDILAGEGKSQANALAGRLANEPIEVIYSSPLKRAMETALPVAVRINKPIEVDRRLIEVDFGDFTGKPYSEIEKVTGISSRQMLNDYEYDFGPYGGENSIQVESRVAEFIDELKKKPYNTALIITHGGIIRWFHYKCNNQKVGATQNAVELRFQI